MDDDDVQQVLPRVPRLKEVREQAAAESKMPGILTSVSDNKWLFIIGALVIIMIILLAWVIFRKDDEVKVVYRDRRVEQPPQQAPEPTPPAPATPPPLEPAPEPQVPVTPPKPADPPKPKIKEETKNIIKDLIDA